MWSRWMNCKSYSINICTNAKERQANSTGHVDSQVATKDERGHRRGDDDFKYGDDQAGGKTRQKPAGLYGTSYYRAI